MLLQLMPEQIQSFWHITKPLLERTLPKIPGESVNKMNNILRNLLIGKMMEWIVYEEDGEGEKKSKSIIITSIIYEDIAEINSLLIYCISAISDTDTISLGAWKKDLKTLGKFALSKNCTRMVSFSTEEVLGIIRRFWPGVEINYHYISYPL